MATYITNEKKMICKQYEGFAKNHIVDLIDLYNLDSFPFNLWSKMAEEKLIGLGIPEDFGGKGGKFFDLLIASEALMKHGKNFGFVMSWLIHEIVSRSFIYKFGTIDQHDEYLFDMASGKKISCLAVSEPGVGAHPKYIKTTAKKEGDSYIINGEKTYITNGPIADIFIIIAITHKSNDKNQFSAFIVSKQNKGLKLTKEIELNFLKPSTHATIELNDCIVSSNSVLGNIGKAYEDMVIKFRETEDVIMMGPVVGGMRFQLKTLANNFYQKTDDNIKYEMGYLKSMIDTASIISYEAAKMLDSNHYHEEFISLLIGFRNIAKIIQDKIKDILIREKITSSRLMELVTNDLSSIGKIALNVILAKQKKLIL